MTTTLAGNRGLARAAAVGLAGLGGLWFETAVVRALGLVLGNTAASAALVVGGFVAGLGLGGAIAARRRADATGRSAALGYALVAVAIAVAGFVTGRLTPLAGIGGTAAALALAGLPGVAMGCAFPRVFDGVGGRIGPAVLCASNLAGSVLGAWSGGNWLLPGLGIRATFASAALCYFAAALVLRAASRRSTSTPTSAREESSPGGTSLESRDLRLAFAAGFVAIGVEVVLLRRLPFFLEGFQPTLSGVLAGFLLAMTLGAALAAPFGRRAADLALWLAVLGAVSGAHEFVGRGFVHWPVGGELGFHLRILLAATLAAAPVAIPAGALVPLLLAPVAAGDRGRAAGAAFCAQGLGSLVGALFVGQFLPLVAPAALFAVAPPSLAALAVVAAPGRLRTRLVLLALIGAACASGIAGAGTPWSPAPPVRGSRYDRPQAYVPLAHASDSGTTASCVYDRSQHALVLFTDEFRAAWIGPNTSYMKVLGHLPFLLRDDLATVAVIAFGTGTTVDAVCAWPAPRAIHVVEISPAVLSLADRFAADGPVAGTRRATFAVDPRVEVHVADGRRWLASRPPRELDLVTMEPLLPYAPGTAALYSREMYALIASRLSPRGVCVQWVPTHAMPAPTFRTLLATFAVAFPHVSAWLVDNATLLVGSEQRHLPSSDELERRFEAATPAARRTLHEAGLATPHDVALALIGTGVRTAFLDAPLLDDDRPFLERIGYWSGEQRLAFLGENLAELARVATEGLDGASPGFWSGEPFAALRVPRLDAAIARNEAAFDPTGAAAAAAAASASALFARAPGSVLLHQEALRARRLAVEAELRAGLGAGTAELARRFVQLDPGSAVARLATVADRGDPPEVDAALARALAIDPTLGVLRPDAFGPHRDRTPAAPRSPLEDLGTLPEGDELARAVSGDGPMAWALRAHYGVRAALALVDASRARPLEPAARAAFAELADPATLDAYALAVRLRGGALLDEVGPCWRSDLAMPEVLRAELAGPPERRARFATLLAGRRGRSAVEVLAVLLEDGESAVRRAAAAALVRSFGERVAYDPDGDAASRRHSADALRVLVHGPR